MHARRQDAARWRMALAALIGAMATPVQAAPDRPARLPFIGAYAGPELGAHEHHVFIEVTDRATGARTGRYYRAWGVGGGAFAGYDLAVARRVRIGAEIEIGVGGTAPVARFADGTYYARRPRWGIGATGRIGYLIGDRLLAYGTFGYGGQNYRVENKAGVADSHDWGSSFTIGAGLEYRLSPNVGVRLDFRHLDNSMSHVLVGLPLRF